MLTVLIIEDEHYTRAYIRKIIENIPLIEKILDTASGREAIKLAQQHRLDIVVTDIELELEEKINGIETARMINNLNPDTEFIFLTGYSKYAIDSFEVHPYDYILKPIKPEKLVQTITSLMGKLNTKQQEVNKQQDKLIIKVKKGTFFIPFDNIIFIEKSRNEVLVHTVDHIHTINQNLNDLETVLRGDFLRVHKSFIVNAAKIEKIKELENRSYEIYFLNYQQTAQLSRYKYDEFKKKFSPTF